MIKPEEVWVAWAVNRSSDKRIELIGSVPYDTSPEDLDVPEYTEGWSAVFERDIGGGCTRTEKSWELCTGSLEMFLEEWLKRKLRNIKLTTYTNY
jgi:hypothetical protein